MVGNSRGKGRKKNKRVMGNHQRCWIWGRHAVLETLRANRWKPVELLCANELSEEELQELTALASTGGLSPAVVSGERLTQLCGSREHQGYLAKMPPFPYFSLSELYAADSELPLPWTGVLLDGLQDPYNFGSILRSAEVLRVDAVFAGTRYQCDVNSLVVRSSAGAVNHLPLFQAENLTEVVSELKKRGVMIVGGSEKATCELDRVTFATRSLIIIGNEGRGISSELLQQCDQRVKIPQFGEIGSLNAAVSAGIFFYELLRQRRLQE